MVTSSAVVGSSAMSSDGPSTSAIAIITRWRMPPESWCGNCFARISGDEMPTAPSIATARVHASLRLAFVWVRTTSAICSPAEYTGFNAVIGS